MELKENERIDDLQCHGRMLIQNKSMFCFGIDAVLLANYAVVNEGDVCMDLCTGNGIIPVLMEAKTKGKHYTGLEIQKESAELARRSVELNNTADRIDIVMMTLRMRLNSISAEDLMLLRLIRHI